MNRKDLLSSNVYQDKSDTTSNNVSSYTGAYYFKKTLKTERFCKKNLEIQKVFQQKSVIVITRNKTIQKKIWGQNILSRKILRP